MRTLLEFDLRPAMLPPGAIEIVTSDHLVETVEDWSGCRAPSRARRRWRQGHPQRHKFVTRPKPGGVMIGGVLYMHPDEYEKLKKYVAQDHQRSVDRMMMDALMGRG